MAQILLLFSSTKHIFVSYFLNSYCLMERQMIIEFFCSVNFVSHNSYYSHSKSLGIFIYLASSMYVKNHLKSIEFYKLYYLLSLRNLILIFVTLSPKYFYGTLFYMVFIFTDLFSFCLNSFTYLLKQVTFLTFFLQ